MRHRSLGFGIAAASFTLLWFALLSGRSLYDPDEGRYAEIPREMQAGGDWVIPHLNGLAYLEKPPLQYWLTALTFRSIGASEFAARLCTGVAGYLSLLLVYLLGVRLWGFDAGVKAFLYTSASTLFFLVGHQLTLDMLLSFWLLGALACFLLAQDARATDRQSRAWMLGVWAAMALAMLTKGLIGVLIPGATLCLYAIWQRDWSALRRLNLRWGLPLFIAIAAPWFILAARSNPAFLRFFFIREHIQRFLTPIEHRTQPWWFFVPVLLVGIMPWVPQAASVSISMWRERVPRGQFDAPRLLWIWCAFTVIFFSLSDSKLIPYILPAIPALALLCANPAAGDGRGRLFAGATLSLASSLGVLAYASGRWGSADAQALLLLVRPNLWSTGAVLAAGALVCVVYALQDRYRAALAGLCVAWMLASATILVAADRAQSLFSAKDMAMTLRRTAVPGAPVYTVQSYEQSLPFYLQHAVVLVNYRDEFDLGLGQAPELGIATLQEFSVKWSSLAQGYAVISPETLERLRALGLPMHVTAQFPGRVIISRR